MKTNLQIITSLIIMLSLPAMLSAIIVIGTVVGSDAVTVGLANADVSLSGNNIYTASTDAQGNFYITDVEPNAPYSYLATHEGYTPAEGTVIVGSETMSMDTIVLNELLYPPQNVLAVSQPPDVFISWSSPAVEQPYNGFMIWRLPDGQEQNQAAWSMLATVNFSINSYTDTDWDALSSGTYKWAVVAVFPGNAFSPPAFSNALQNPVANPLNDIPNLSTMLLTCWPNPFSSATHARFALKNTAQVQLEVYNIKGQKVRTLVNATKASGYHSIDWSGTDDNNRQLATGVYYFRMTVENSVLTAKVLLLQ